MGASKRENSAPCAAGISGGTRLPTVGGVEAAGCAGWAAGTGSGVEAETAAGRAACGAGTATSAVLAG